MKSCVNCTKARGSTVTDGLVCTELANRIGSPIPVKIDVEFWCSGYEATPGYRLPDEEPVPSEKYPDNNPKSQFGSKKVPFSTIPPTSLVELARWQGFGGFKYGPFNWQGDNSKVAASVYFEAIMRHLILWYSGIDVDPENGRAMHLGAVMAGASIMIDATRNGNLLDDRPKCPDMEALFKEVAEDMKDWRKPDAP